MVASVSAAEWQHSQDALRDEVRRVTILMRSISDPGVPAVGQWNIADVAMHLSQNWILVPGLARQDLSRYRAVVHGIAEVAGDSMIPDMWDNADMNALALTSDAERDLAVLADRIEERAEEYFGECAGHSPDEPRPWTVEGTTVPLSALAMVVRQFFVPVLQTCDPRTFVNAETAAGIQATYKVHLRGGGRLNFVFDDGSLRIEEPSTRRVDCHISADPAAFFMMFWDRQSQWNAIAKGQLVAGAASPGWG